MTGKNKREAWMRIKPEGTLDADWWEPGSSKTEQYARSQHPTKTPEQLREQLINNLLRARPTLTRETAAEQIDAVFKGAVTP
jgi:hypothetical protein